MSKFREVGQYLDLGFFIWPKANAGYYIDSNAVPDLLTCVDDKVTGPFIIETPETTGYVTTMPLNDNQTLFLDFAEIDGSEKSMIEFANQHGLLTDGTLLENIPHHSRAVGGGTIISKLIWGDTLVSWQNAHFAMKHTVQLWEWLKILDLEKLSLIIHWYDDNRAIRYFLGAEDDLRAMCKDGAIMGPDHVKRRKDNNEPLRLLNGELASELSPPGLLARFVPGDVVIPAQTAMQKIINEKLKEYPTRPMLLMDNSNKLKQYFVPKNLLSAMWFQFFQAASGERKHKRCEVCKKWEDVTDKKATWTKHPECAGRERTAKYRERIKRESV